MRCIEKTLLFLKDVKLEHTLFSLPFLLSGIIIAEKYSLKDLFILFLGLFSARISGMAWNRYVDREIDALNPRTKTRPLAIGIINPAYYKYVTILSLTILFVVAAYYNMLCVALFPLVAILILIYPYLKRYTSISHIILGVILSFSILGPYVALTNSISLHVSLLAIAITFWVAGFDVIYSLQDYEFDKSYGLKSIPSIYGKKKAKLIAFGFHLISSLLLILFFYVINANILYAIPLIFILLLEHLLININEKYILHAFQNLNIIFSITFLIIIILLYW